MASADILVVENEGNADHPTHGVRVSSLIMETISSSHEAKRRKVTPKTEYQSDSDSDSDSESESVGADEDESTEADERSTQGAVEADSVNERLNALQHLLPHGLELEEDEILRVAVEYVKELEMEIQMFGTSSKDWCRHNNDMGDAPLQKRGLCIVPLSTLAKAKAL